MKPKLASVCICLFLAGCATTAGDNSKWYNPTTWFSGSSARKIDKINGTVSNLSNQAVHQAKIAVHKTGQALAIAPTSRPVVVATQANQQAQTLLDQVDGAPTAYETTDLKEQVRLLISENAEERAKGEAMTNEFNGTVNKLSNDIRDANAEKQKLEAALRVQFGNENALANEYRNQTWWKWFWIILLGSLFMLCAGGWVYLRLTIGGLPTALGKTLGGLRTTNPEAAQALTETLDVHTTPFEQKLIRILTAKNPAAT